MFFVQEPFESDAPPRDPCGADEEDDITVLEQDGSGEGVCESGEVSGGEREIPCASEPEHAGPCDEEVCDGVETKGPRVVEESEEDFAWVEYGGHWDAEERYAGILSGVPERPASGVPLLLDAEVEWVVEVGGIAISELFTAEEYSVEADEQEDQGDKLDRPKARRDASGETRCRMD